MRGLSTVSGATPRLSAACKPMRSASGRSCRRERRRSRQPCRGLRWLGSPWTRSGPTRCLVGVSGWECRMRRRRAKARKPSQATSGPGEDHGGYPLDEIPPDDLPVRDIAEDDERHPAERAANPDPGRHGRRAPRSGRQPKHPDSLEVPSKKGTVIPASPADLLPNDGSAQVTSEPQAGTDAGSTPAQYQLPGLASGADREQSAGQPKRPRQHRTSSARKALRAMQMELWSDDHDPASST